MTNEKTIYLTILLCTYNRAKLLDPLLEKLIYQVKSANSKEIEILLINNNSDDNTENIVKKHIKSIDFLNYDIEPNLGLAKARNKGLSKAKGKIISFIDDDILLNENWLNEVLKSTQSYNYKAFGGRVIPLWEKEKPPYINLNGLFSLNQKIFPAHDNGETEKLYPITKSETNPIGANMWIYKDLFDKYGGFREDLGRVGYGGIPCEDTEFFSRLIKKNEKIFYYPNAIVLHPVSIYRMSKEFIKSWHYRNGISTVRKGDRRFAFMDIYRFIIRILVFIPFFILMYLIGLISINQKIRYWSKFNTIRVLGQLREFLRIWFKIPLKDPTY